MPLACATLTPAVDANGTLTLSPTSCGKAERPRCLLVPVYPPHFVQFFRLIETIRRYAIDRASAPLVAVFSEPAPHALARICKAFPTICDGSFEATSLDRLLDLSMDAFDSSKSPRLPAGPSKERLRRAAALARAVGALPTCPGGCPPSFYTQALKKLLGTAHVRCRRVWVVDSESMPFRPFSFARIFDDYWRDPLVVTNGVPLHRDAERSIFGTLLSALTAPAQPCASAAQCDAMYGHLVANMSRFERQGYLFVASTPTAHTAHALPLQQAVHSSRWRCTVCVLQVDAAPRSAAAPRLELHHA
jgi:hypothetical protein